MTPVRRTVKDRRWRRRVAATTSAVLAGIVLTGGVLLQASAAEPVVGSAVGAVLAVPTGDPCTKVLNPVADDHPPAIQHPDNTPVDECGIDADVTAIGDDLWQAMTGTTYSTAANCRVTRDQLRVIHMNFWGFNGKHYRGRLVVRAAWANEIVGAFTALHGQGFRIRRMDPLTAAWPGKTPGGYPGADDRESMRDDNTSGFNCRYKTFDESNHTWSPHRCGWAIDVNPWENPERTVLADPKYYPDTWFINHRTGAGVFKGDGDDAVKAFTNRGFFWGGDWSPGVDFQHFQPTSSPSDCNT